MKTRFLLGALLSVLALVPVMGQTNTETATEVKKAVEEFNKAFLEADVVRLHGLLTDDYIHSNSGSKVINKMNWLKYIKTRRRQLDRKILQVKDYKMSDVVIKVYGNTAVVNALITSSGIMKRKPFLSAIRCTHVWIKEGGVWKRAAFHDSKLR
ncbi:MAG TPA: hypothetical protein DCS93_26165 [Microscillaceae bacterium]|nr:hypothetical protein [Microscillaceae bacterium]